METAQSTAEQVWTNIAIGLGSGVVASVLASAAFFFMLYKLRPSIDISPEIARTRMPEGDIAFRIKIINRSRFPALDLQIAVYRMKPRGVTGGQVSSSKQLNTRHSFVPVLGKYKKKDPKADYALRFRIVDDVDREWTSDDAEYLQLRIAARHGFSGAFGTFHKEYYTKKNAIKDGQFAFGDNFAIS